MSLHAEFEFERNPSELLAIAEGAGQRSLLLAEAQAILAFAHANVVPIAPEDFAQPELGSEDTPVLDERVEDNTQRNALVQQNIGLAKLIAHRFKARNCEQADLEQVAQEGLIKAADRFDPEAGFSFAAFASTTISGEVKRYFRDKDWMIHVPRTLKDNGVAVRLATEYLEREAVSVPTNRAIAELAGLTLDQVKEAKGVTDNVRHFASLDAPASTDSTLSIGDFVLDTDAVDFDTALIDKELIYQVLDKIDPKLKEIVILRYWEELSQAQIAKQVRLSQVHVSRLLRKAHEQMRDVLTNQHLPVSNPTRLESTAAGALTAKEPVGIEQSQKPLPAKIKPKAGQAEAVNTDLPPAKKAVKRSAKNEGVVTERSLEWQSDTVRDYLNTIGSFPVLTRQEEFELGNAVQEGKKAAVALEGLLEQNAPLSQLRDLRRIIAEGEAARQKFINCNYKLVVSIAKKYQGHGVPLMDLIQEGNIGMMHAVDLFDHQKGFKFSTYGTWWIRQHLQRAVESMSSVIRWPNGVNDKFKAYLNTLSELALAGVKVSDEEMCRLIEVKPDMLELLKTARKQGRDPVSLDTPLSEGTDTLLGDMVGDQKSSNGFEEVENSIISTDVVRILHKKLTSREMEIVEKRFGLQDGHPRTFAEIGASQGVTGEHIRRMLASIVQKVRQYPELASYL